MVQEYWRQKALTKVVQKFGAVELCFGGIKKERYHTRGEEDPTRLNYST